MLRLNVFSLSVFLLSQTAFILCESDQQPPLFFQSPPKQIVFAEGGKVTLTCNATGIPEVTYSWKKDGTDLSSPDPNGNVLEISSASRSDEGQYQCFAKNKHGTAFTDVAHLRIAVLQAVGSAHQTGQVNATEGQPFTIPGSSFKVIPESRSYEDFVWKKNEDVVSLSNRIQVADNGDLYFAYAMTVDDLEGKLYTNSFRNPISKAIVEGNHTKVTVSPNTVQELAPTLAFSSVSRSVALEGENVSLRCFFNGKPEPSINWLRSSGTLPADRFVQSNFNTELTLMNITKSDATYYHCLGINTHGSTSHSLTFQVQAAPKFVDERDRPHEQYVAEKDNATFNCKATADPKAEVEWFYNGVSLTKVARDRFEISADRKSLTIRSVCRECKGHDGQKFSDTGVIQCNASNVHGYALGSGYLTVITIGQAASRNAAIVEVSSVIVNFAFIALSAIAASLPF